MGCFKSSGIFLAARRELLFLRKPPNSENRSRQGQTLMKGTRKLTFIQQNDIHAQFESHWEMFWENGRPTYRKAGGFSRIATMIREIRDRNKDACLPVDCADHIPSTWRAPRTY